MRRFPWRADKVPGGYVVGDATKHPARGLDPGLFTGFARKFFPRLRQFQELLLVLWIGRSRYHFTAGVGVLTKFGCVPGHLRPRAPWP